MAHYARKMRSSWSIFAATPELLTFEISCQHILDALTKLALVCGCHELSPFRPVEDDAVVHVHEDGVSLPCGAMHLLSRE